MARPINLTRQNVTIPSGQALTPEIDISGDTLVGICMPAGWDAAALTFQMTPDGSTFLEMQGASAVLTYSAAAGQYIAVDPALWRGVNAFKIRSGTSVTPVNQTANRTLTVITKPVA